jgi:hypothetical protein
LTCSLSLSADRAKPLHRLHVVLSADLTAIVSIMPDCVCASSIDSVCERNAPCLLLACQKHELVGDPRCGAPQPGSCAHGATRSRWTALHSKLVLPPPTAPSLTHWVISRTAVSFSTFLPRATGRAHPRGRAVTVAALVATGRATTGKLAPGLSRGRAQTPKHSRVPVPRLPWAPDSLRHAHCAGPRWRRSGRVRYTAEAPRRRQL